MIFFHRRIKTISLNLSNSLLSKIHIFLFNAPSFKQFSCVLISELFHGHLSETRHGVINIISVFSQISSVSIFACCIGIQNFSIGTWKCILNPDYISTKRTTFVIFKRFYKSSSIFNLYFFNFNPLCLSQWSKQVNLLRELNPDSLYSKACLCSNVDLQSIYWCQYLHRIYFNHKNSIFILSDRSMALNLI